MLRDDDIREGEVARKLLGISLSPSQSASSISVVDIAAVMEKPGVQTPSRKSEFEEALHDKQESEVEVKIDSPTRRGRRHPPPPVPPLLATNGGKKLPPKTPPRRRTKLKSVASTGAGENEKAE